LAWPYLILTLLYSGLIAWMSGQSEPPVPSDVFPHWDKVMHVGAFGLMDLLVLLGMLRSKYHYSLRALLIAPALYTILFGIGDEFHQAFTPGREVDPLDIVSDTLGAVLMQTCFWLSVRYPALGRWWPARLPGADRR
jgi:VanZ family protein